MSVVEWGLEGVLPQVHHRQSGAARQQPELTRRLLRPLRLTGLPLVLASGRAFVTFGVFDVTLETAGSCRAVAEGA